MKVFIKKISFFFIKEVFISLVLSAIIIGIFLSISNETKNYYLTTFLYSENQYTNKNTENLIFFKPYTFKKNDNIWNISRAYGVNIDSLLSINFPNITKPSELYTIRPGKIIKIPYIDGLFEPISNNLKELSQEYKIDENILTLFNNNSFTSSEKSYYFIPWKHFSLEKLTQMMGHQFFSPLKYYTRISGLFGIRIHPITKKRAFHKGIDMVVNFGTTVYSSLGGRVLFAGHRGGYGKYVLIQHKNSLTTGYAHLSKIMVRSGQTVGIQTPVGRVGSTGRATGNHLHFEIKKNTKAINPIGLVALKKNKMAINSLLEE